MLNSPNLATRLSRSIQHLVHTDRRRRRNHQSRRNATITEKTELGNRVNEPGTALVTCVKRDGRLWRSIGRRLRGKQEGLTELRRGPQQVSSSTSVVHVLCDHFYNIVFVLCVVNQQTHRSSANACAKMYSRHELLCVTCACAYVHNVLQAQKQN